MIKEAALLCKCHGLDFTKATWKLGIMESWDIGLHKWWNFGWSPCFVDLAKRRKYVSMLLKVDFKKHITLLKVQKGGRL